MKLLKQSVGKFLIKKFSLLGVLGISTTSIAACSLSPLNFDSSIQLVVSDSSSTLADQSFSESAYIGISNYFKDNFNITLPPASSSLIRENNGIWKRPGVDVISRVASYKYAFDDGAKIIVATGFNQQEALQQVSSTNPNFTRISSAFKNNGFIFLDGSLEQGNDPSSAPFFSNYNSVPYNIASVRFRAAHGGFLAGISSAVFLNLNQQFFMFNGKLGVSGFVGLALPSTLNFLNGFRLGIHYWNSILQPRIKTVDNTLSTHKIHWISMGTDPNDFSASNFVSGNFSAANSRVNTLVQNARRNGANVIFPIAGPQTSLVVAEIGSSQGSEFARSIVLGVDTAQENNVALNNNLPQGSEIGEGKQKGKIIQFSTIKNLTFTAQAVIEAITEGRNNADSQPSEKGYRGLGWNNTGTVSNSAVGVSDAGLKYLIDPLFWTDFSASSSETSNEEINKAISSNGNTTLKELVEKRTAKALLAKDPIVAKYIAVLNGKTKTTLPSNEASSTLSQPPSAPTPRGDANSDVGINGPLNDGSWKINNNLPNLNSFLEIKLSSLLPALSPSDDTSFKYFSPSDESDYVGGKDHNISITKQEMFFRQN